MNHGIKRILIDLVVSSEYLPGVLRGAPSSAVLLRLRLVGWATPGGATLVVYRGYPGSYPPQVCSTELRNLVSSFEYLVSNERQVLLGDIRLGGSATPPF